MNMEHYLIIKFKENVDARKEFPEIQKLFEKAKEIDGVTRADVYLSSFPLKNRYDMMIKIKMRKGALPSFEESAINKIWEENYKDKIKIVTVFDR